MSNILAAGRALELLDDLKGTVEALAARAANLEEEYRAQTSRERRRGEAALQDQARQLAAALEQAESNFRSAEAAAQAKFEQRKARIGRAYQASKDQGLKNIEDGLGARKYDLQKKMLQAERDRETGLANTAANYQEFKQSLAAEEQTLVGLERRAQRAFKGYRGLVRLFFRSYEKAQVDLAPDHHGLLAALREQAGRAESELTRFQSFPMLRLLRTLWVWVALALGGGALVLQRFGLNQAGEVRAGAVAAGGFLVILALRYVVQRQIQPLAASISTALAKARRLHDAGLEKSESYYQRELQRLKTEFTEMTRASDQQLKAAMSDAADRRVSCRMRSDQRTVRAINNNERLYHATQERLNRERADVLQGLKTNGEARARALQNQCDEKLTQFTASYTASHHALEVEWKSRLEPLYTQLKSGKDMAEKLFQPWTAPQWATWTPPAKFGQAARFAELRVEVAQLCEAVPADNALALPGPGQFAVPLCLAYPEQGSVLFETGNSGHQHAIGALNNIILRLLATAPPGRLNFTILDPVGLGQNFAGVMHLADYEEQIINSRIWTQSTQIEQKLADLNEHMEKVIQMYLRNEYQTIAEYNEQAGVIAEKYYFLVVADFPANFTETAAKRLLSIAASGARCGVYMLLHWDHRLPLPAEFIPDDLRKSCFTLVCQGKDFVPSGQARPGVELQLDEPPTPELATAFIHQVGRWSRDSSRVEVPFEHVAPAEAEVWSEETTNELRVPIGRTGATKLQYLAIGKGTRQHGLVAGKTGSGKSTLFHVLITNLALWCSPDQVEFYLVDFKKGVEFKCYGAKRLPHARVVAIESDREFGLSVLQRVDEELKRRGDLFRQLGVQDLAGYKRAGGAEKMPRTLLLIDEFQEFFVEDDKIAQTASLLLDRIVRQGRAFGIHVLLGSQTLGGAYTVARTTLGQMVIRIALQCNEADAYLIMDDTNPAPRLLSRPGEGIYNDMAGALEGNSPFQVVWLPEEVRDRYLAKVRERADRAGEAYPGPIVFEGNAPADVRENALLRNLLAAKTVQPAPAGRIWLGAPNSIKGPTEALFQRQSGNHLLIVGQRDEAVLAMVSLGLVALAAQYPPGAARLILCDTSPPGTPPREYLERVLQAIPHPVTLAKPGDLPKLMQELATEMKHRTEAADSDAAPPVFLFIHGLQKYSKLRFEEDFGFSSSEPETEVKPAAVLNDLVCEGARLGFHLIATCDSYNNVSRFLSRKALSEFEMRVLFQMSANDSASLIDNPKAGLLGLHRALFFNAQEGYLETFRPYALPPTEWLDHAAQNLARLLRAP